LDLSIYEGTDASINLVEAVNTLKAALGKDLNFSANFGYIRVIATIFQLDKRCLPLLINDAYAVVLAVVKYRLENNI